MIHTDCIPCFRKQADRLFEKCGIPEPRQVVLKAALNRFIEEEGEKNPAPLSGHFLNRLVKEETGIEDLYLEEKRYYNRLMMERLPEMREQVRKSADPLQTALRYALAGNIIDFGPPQSFDLEATFSEALEKVPAIDHSNRLFEMLGHADTVLYLGDNAGEMVADRLFIETLNHPNLYFAVRGQPVLNDATEQDAMETGMHEVAQIVNNGFDAPSTLLSYCSEAFNELYDKADVVISKGQGNFEGLWDEKRNPNVFFLFMVKCDVIANLAGCPKGSSVVMQSRSVKG